MNETETSPTGLCKEAGCNKPVQVEKRGLCSSHYQMWAMANKPRAGLKDCSVEQCSGHVYAKGMCRNHYDRMRTYGSVGLYWERNPKGQCHCGKPQYLRASNLCKSHYVRDWYDKTAGTRSIADFDDEPKTHQSAHFRVVAIRGKASDFLCEICGQPAKEWALSADAKDLRFAPIHGRETLTAFSVNPYQYFSACVKCHRAYDAKHKNRNYKLQQARWEETA